MFSCASYSAYLNFYIYFFSFLFSFVINSNTFYIIQNEYRIIRSYDRILYGYLRKYYKTEAYQTILATALKQVLSSQLNSLSPKFKWNVIEFSFSATLELGWHRLALIGNIFISSCRFTIFYCILAISKGRARPVRRAQELVIFFCSEMITKY